MYSLIKMTKGRNPIGNFDLEKLIKRHTDKSATLGLITTREVNRHRRLFLTSLFTPTANKPYPESNHGKVVWKFDIQQTFRRPTLPRFGTVR